MKLTAEIKRAYEKAKDVQKRAYAPYSKFQVGCAIKLKKPSEIVIGCNVENASFGATVCAERVAVSSAIAEYGKSEIEFIVVVTNTDPCIGPCALCLQVLSEFCSSDVAIYLGNQNELQGVVSLGELLPTPFAKIPPQI